MRHYRGIIILMGCTLYMIWEDKAPAAAPILCGIINHYYMHTDAAGRVILIWYSYNCPLAIALAYVFSSFCSGASLIISSILRIVMAASVANLMLLILLIAGSSTPAFLLSLTAPVIRSKPNLECWGRIINITVFVLAPTPIFHWHRNKQLLHLWQWLYDSPHTIHSPTHPPKEFSTEVYAYHLRPSLSVMVWEALWKALNLATSSVESSAAFTDRVLGITRRALANSATASCSLDVCGGGTCIWYKSVTSTEHWTYNWSGKCVQVYRQSSFYCPTSRNDLVRLQHSLDYT